jgi:hypothetical protein
VNQKKTFQRKAACCESTFHETYSEAISFATLSFSFRAKDANGAVRQNRFDSNYARSIWFGEIKPVLSDSSQIFR